MTPLEKVCAKCGGDPKPIEQFPIRKRSRRISKWSKAKEVVLEADSWCITCRSNYDRDWKSKKRKFRRQSQ